jgi:hypothetical protein
VHGVIAKSADFALVCPGGCGYPFGVTIDPVSDNLFVSDNMNSRVLRYGPISTLSASSMPTAVFGQPDFSSISPNQGGSMTLATLLYPQQVFCDSYGTLWVADTNNNRVLWWINAAQRGNGTPADGYFGQTSSSVNAYSMNGPGGLFMDTL